MHEGPAERRWTAVAVVLLLTLVASACGSSHVVVRATPRAATRGVSRRHRARKPGGNLVYGLEAESDGWNPSNSKWAPSGLMVARAVFDTLTAYDADLNAQPFLAEKLTPNADYTQWTITLRPDITLHNGRPVDSERGEGELRVLEGVDVDELGLRAGRRASRPAVRSTSS